MKKPIISVITTAFNVESYIERTIKSVLKQSYKNFEYLIINDGSSDQTLKIAQQYANYDNRIRVFNLKHCGPSSARNFGIESSKAKFISFLDGDDTWLPSFLEKQLRTMRKMPRTCLATFCWSNVVDESDKLVGYRATDIGKYDLFKTLVCICPPGNGSSLLLKKASFIKSGLFDRDIPAGQDSEMWYRLLATHKHSHFYCFPEVLVNYRVRPHSLSKTSMKTRMEGKELSLKRYAAKCGRGQALVFGSFAAYALMCREYSYAKKWLNISEKLRPTLFKK